MGERFRIRTGKRARARREEAVQEALDALGAFELALVGRAMSVACAGVWGHWNDRVAVGTEVRLEPDSFRGCGDSTVEQLASLAAYVRAIADDIEEGERGAKAADAADRAELGLDDLDDDSDDDDPDSDSDDDDPDHGLDEGLDDA